MLFSTIDLPLQLGHTSIKWADPPLPPPSSSHPPPPIPPLPPTPLSLPPSPNEESQHKIWNMCSALGVFRSRLQTGNFEPLIVSDVTDILKITLWAWNEIVICVTDSCSKCYQTVQILAWIQTQAQPNANRSLIKCLMWSECNRQHEHWPTSKRCVCRLGVYICEHHFCPCYQLLTNG